MDSQTSPFIQDLAPDEISPEQQQKQKQMMIDLTHEGRIQLKEKLYLQASKSFSKAIMAFEFLLKNQRLSPSQTKVILSETIIPCYSNLSLCHIHLGSYDTVVLLSNQILTHNKSHVKALYRRGIAYKNLKKYDEAAIDFELAGKLDQEILESAKAQINECKRLKKMGQQREKEIAKRFLQGNEREYNDYQQKKEQNRCLKCIKSLIKKITGK